MANDILPWKKSNISSPEQKRIVLLRKKAEPRDLVRLKEEMMNQTGGFGGLKNQVTLMCNAVEKIVFYNYDDSQINRYLFSVGMKREKIPEALERAQIFLEFLEAIVTERIKTEKDWRPSDSKPKDAHSTSNEEKPSTLQTDSTSSTNDQSSLETKMEEGNQS